VSEQVTARACTNIALCKYWGKQGPGNAPATPSISLALDALTVTMTVSRSRGADDVIRLPRGLNRPVAAARIREYLKLWRRQRLVTGSLRVESEMNFPAGAGLASSAAAYAALARALAGLSNVSLSTGQLSRLARHGSGSAARSITGGISALPAGTDPAARQLAPPSAVPWGMVVALVSAKHKDIASRPGMEASRRSSPYYERWLKQAARDYRAALKAIVDWDLDATGRIAEANMLAMHAVMLATRPALVYWEPATLALIRLAARLRDAGLPAYATIDAGPNVALLCHRDDLQGVAARARRVAGVERTITSLPGGPSEIID
jgi:diphosphomevalonate decarboxylase